MYTLTARDLTNLDEVAIGIFQLIGSYKKLEMMIGAHSFVKGHFYDSDRPGIQFKFPRSNQINCCQIVLNRQTDEYCLLFLDVKGFNFVERGNYQNLPLENVCRVFE